MEMVIFTLFICEIVPLKHDSLITILMDPKHSVIKGLHCIFDLVFFLYIHLFHLGQEHVWKHLHLLVADLSDFCVPDEKSPLLSC